jgi:hypothetical protein
MITVQLLETDDHVYPDDWCRPLAIVSMSGGQSDYYSFQSAYTGAPENNVKWVKVKYILGRGWHGKTVKEIDAGLGKWIKYEFLRGDVPKRQQLDLRDYNVTDYSTEFIKEEDFDDDVQF